MTIASDTAAPTAFAAAWRAWHETHEADRASAHGFLAITAQHWLTGEPTAYDGLPGRWSTGVDGPVALLGEGRRCSWTVRRSPAASPSARSPSAADAPPRSGTP
ncbi:hypothetical protein [Leifsonia xyli]|uniref:hypothetical protein n=1 Tax=Leifsonia xyli TaxID=1575 RepID=UPI003D6652E7